MVAPVSPTPPRQFLAKMTVPLLGNVILLLVGFISTRLMTGNYAPADFGLVAYVNGVTWFFFIFADLGLGATHTRKIAQGENLADCLQVYIRTKLILTAILLLPIFFILKWHIPRFGSAQPPEVVLLVIIASTTTWSLTVFGQALSYTFAGLQQIRRQIAMEILRSVTLVLCMVVAHFWRLNVWFLALSYVISAAAPLLLGIIWLRKSWGGRFRWDLFHAYRLYIAPTFGYMMIQNIPRNLDGFIVAEAAGVYQAGIYYAAKRLASPLEQCTGYLGHMLLPMLSKLSHDSRDLELGNFLLRSERFLAILFVPVAVGAMYFSPTVSLLLLGPSYGESDGAIRLLVIAAVVAIIGSPYAFLPTAVGKPIITTKISGWTTALWIGVAVLLVPSHLFTIQWAGYGALGCGAATLLMALGQSTLERRQSRNLIAGLNPSRSWCCVGPALIGGGAGYLILLLLPIGLGKIISITLAALAMLCLYAALLWFSKFLTADERAKITEYYRGLRNGRVAHPAPND
jgi:O-antigen/teichoic acid export membrane protein